MPKPNSDTPSTPETTSSTESQSGMAEHLATATESVKEGWSLLKRSLVIVIPATLLLYVIFYLISNSQRQVIRIGTAWKGSFYDKLGNDLGDSLKEQGAKVRIDSTHGTPDNIERLRLKQIDVALIQGGAYKADHSTTKLNEIRDLAVVIPLTTEVLHVLVHKSVKEKIDKDNKGISLSQILSHPDKFAIYCGDARSGSHISAEQVLAQYGMKLDSRGAIPGLPLPRNVVPESPSYSFWQRLDSQLVPGLRSRVLSFVHRNSNERSVSAAAVHAHFNAGSLVVNEALLWLIESGYIRERRGGAVACSQMKLKEGGQLPDLYPDIAIITTHPRNQRLELLLKSGEYFLASVDAEALTARHPHYLKHSIPTRRYGTSMDLNAIPSHPITTVATTTYVAVSAEAPAELVNELIQARHSHQFRARHVRNLISVDEIKQQYIHSTPFHPTAEAYYNPFNPEELATWVEFLSGSKEILIAFGAVVYLGVSMRRRYRSKQNEEARDRQHQLLDRYLHATTKLEADQMAVHDVEKLRDYLDKVTKIKLSALNNLDHMDLRGDQRFSIFLMQCANLISKIQFKIITYSDHPDEEQRDEA